MIAQLNYFIKISYKFILQSIIISAYIGSIMRGKNPIQALAKYYKIGRGSYHLQMPFSQAVEKQSAISRNLTIESKLNHLNMMIQHFVDNYETYKKPLLLHGNGFDYVAWFARSCLIAKKSLNSEETYRTVKKAIRAAMSSQRMSPHSCTLIAEVLNNFKFEGDENSIIEYLCRYYNECWMFFSLQQQQAFWKQYLKLMGDKAHGSIKFQPLQRKADKEEQNSLSTKLEYLLQNNLIKINHQIIESISFPSPNQILLKTKIKPLNVSKTAVTIKIRSLLNPNQLLAFEGTENDEEVQEIEEMQIEDEEQNNLRSSYPPVKEEALQQIMAINSALKKKWKVIFRNEGNLEIRELAELRQSNKYRQGILYKSTHPNEREIEHIPTLVLGIAPQHLRSVLQYSYSKDFVLEKASSFFSLPAIKQCYGYAQMCEFHWQLFNAFHRIQGFQRYLDTEKMKQQFGILKGEQEGDHQQGEMSQIEMEQLIELTLSKTDLLFFETDYYKKMRGSLCGLVASRYWHLNPQFIDSIAICDTIKNDPSPSHKYLILANESEAVDLANNLLEAKFLTVPPIRIDPEDDQLRASIVKELYK